MSSSSAFVPTPLVAERTFRPLAEAGFEAEPAPSAAAAGPAEESSPTDAPIASPEDSPEYQRGLEAGLAQGREEGAEAARAEFPAAEVELLRSAGQSLEEAARGMGALERGYWVENRKIVVELALALAHRLLGRELAADPDALAGIVERALEALGDRPPVTLRVAPAVAEALADGRTANLAALAEAHGFVVESDARLAPGDARVLAERTAVDARVAESLRRIGEELSEAAEQAAIPSPGSDRDAASAGEDGTAPEGGPDEGGRS